MKYVIMCGGNYLDTPGITGPKHLVKVNGERLVDRTIKLLNKNNISNADIVITISDINALKYFSDLGVSVIARQNDYDYIDSKHSVKGYWVNAFCDLKQPATYLFGDVYYSEAAIKKIVEADTDDILFFGQAKPFAFNYIKNWVEPAAFKVVNRERFFNTIEYAKQLDDEHKGWRPIIAWELWALLKGLPIEVHFFRKGTPEILGDGFIPIQDYTCDIDDAKEVREMEQAVEKEKLIDPKSSKKIFGIVSYLPDNTKEREKRIERLENLLAQLWKLWPRIPVILIAQNYGKYRPRSKQKLIYCDYQEGLGIINARKALRREFLKTGYDWLIMFDDDAIIECNNTHAAVEFINELDKHPNGFCFLKNNDPTQLCPYVKSQLNLCAVSRYIYEQEPIPYIDPQKGQAFEDAVWSTLLHYKYPELEFDIPEGIKCVHFKNPEINKLGGEVQSTWANEATFNWAEMNKTTNSILQYIKNNRTLPDFDQLFKNKLVPLKKLNTDKIDLVVPYVDNTDPYWQHSFAVYNPAIKVAAINGNNRFRPNAELFKYFFRCIDQNLPWINNIYLLVQSDSQVPSWLDTNRVKVIKHYQFIPGEFLPTFNSCTIEMFLWNIPGLSERFLYVNDDFFVLNKTKPENWFGENGKVKFNYRFDLNFRPKEIYYSQLRSNVEVISPEKEGVGFRLFHIPKPYYKSRVRDCYFKYEDKIRANISRLREAKNNNSYIFNYYDYINGFQENNNLTHKYCSLSDIDECISTIIEKVYDTFVINDDTIEINPIIYKKFIAAFNKYFSKYCKYEKENTSRLATIYNSIPGEYSKIEEISEKNKYLKIFKKLRIRSKNL